MLLPEIVLDCTTEEANDPATLRLHPGHDHAAAPGRVHPADAFAVAATLAEYGRALDEAAALCDHAKALGRRLNRPDLSLAALAAAGRVRAALPEAIRAEISGAADAVALAWG